MYVLQVAAPGLKQNGKLDLWYSTDLLVAVKRLANSTNKMIGPNKYEDYSLVMYHSQPTTNATALNLFYYHHFLWASVFFRRIGRSPFRRTSTRFIRIDTPHSNLDSSISLKGIGCALKRRHSNNNSSSEFSWGYEYDRGWRFLPDKADKPFVCFDWPSVPQWRPTFCLLEHDRVFEELSMSDR